MDQVEEIAEAKPAQSGAERRVWTRVPAEALKTLSAQLATGASIRLLDLSRGGARFESERRFLPNSTVALQLVTADGIVTARGRVVRSKIIRMNQGGLGYEVGVAFNEILDRSLEGEAHPVTPPTPPEIHEVKPVQFPSELPDPAPESTQPNSPASPSTQDGTAAAYAPELDMVTLTATVSNSAEELRDLFDGNDW